MMELARTAELRERFGVTAMADLLARVDQIEHELLGTWGGREADRTDGYLLLFETVDAALGWAGELHARLRRLSQARGLPVVARVGIHRGAVFLIDIGQADRARGAKAVEVEGLAKPAAARIMSVAHAGQSLLSGAAAAELGSGARLRSHGWWILKGLEEPIQLFEAGPGAVPSQPPADVEKVFRVVRIEGSWRPIRELPADWPSETDPFVGRETELIEITTILDEPHAAVVLTGPPGIGKRRLAAHVGWRWRGSFPGGLWRGPSPEGGLGMVPMERDGAPALGLCRGPGPWSPVVVLPLGPLSLPESVEQLEQSAAVQLFLSRARARRPGWRPADREAVLLLMGHLEGVPLAIERAASRILVLSPREMCRYLSSSGEAR